MKNLKNTSKKHIIKIYKNDKFLGYIKSYRKHRNGKYRFVKTLNINDSLNFYSTDIGKAIDKLSTQLDLILYFNDVYTFKSSELTGQEIRNSKLRVLSFIKIKEGIFKNR